MFFKPPAAPRVQPELPPLEPTVLQSPSPHRAKIALAPFLRGASETVGGSLQRVLLSAPGSCSPPCVWHAKAGADPSPVKRLDFAVEPARSGARIDLERLLVDIETDGSVAPVEALCRGARVLMSMMEGLSPGEDARGSQVPPRLPEPVHDPLLDTPIDELDLSVRTTRGLRALGIQRIADLIRFSAAELLRAPYLGRRSLIEIEDALRVLGLLLARGAKDGPAAARDRPH